MTEARELMTTGNPMEDFQNKLKQKVREDIANLLPEEAVSALVKKAIEEEFFSREKENVGTSYHPQWQDKPSAFVREVVNAARPMLEAEIKKCVDEKKDLIAQEIAKFVEAQNLTLLIAAAIGQAMSNNIYSVAELVTRNIKQGY